MPLPDKLIAQALDLPDADRAELAHRLLASLHGEDDAEPGKGQEAQVAQEFDRRAQEVLAGKVEMVDGEDVMRRARERLRSR